MKYYIIITANIHPIGGMQNYVAGKTAYLERQGWKVFVFFAGLSTGKCAMPFLDRYLSGGMIELATPPGEWTKGIRQKTLDRMLDVIGDDSQTAKCIIVESSDEVTSLWGELLSRKLRAKHMCFICNEVFRGPKKHYAEYLDFFDFKHKRRELACIHEDSMSKLFEGYKEVNPEESYVLVAANEGPVQDVESCRVERLQVYDWNICCIGRSDKTCVPNIMEGISAFAQKYPQKKIQLIMLGELGEKEEWIHEQLKSSENIVLTPVGDMVPIPRALYAKLDVVIASSGCAYCSVFEKVPVIVVDAGNALANGILGYTTFDTLFHEEGIEQMKFDKALEQALVEKIQDKLEFSWPEMPPAEHYYKQHLEFIKQSEKKKEYFPILGEAVKVDYINVLKYEIRKYFPFAITIYKKLRVYF